MRIWIEGEYLLNNAPPPNPDDVNPCGHQELTRQVCKKSCGVMIYFKDEIFEFEVMQLYGLIERILLVIMPDLELNNIHAPETFLVALSNRSLATLIAVDETRIPNINWVLYQLYPILETVIANGCSILPCYPVLIPIRFGHGQIVFGICK